LMKKEYSRNKQEKGLICAKKFELKNGVDEESTEA